MDHRLHGCLCSAQKADWESLQQKYNMTYFFVLWCILAVILEFMLHIAADIVLLVRAIQSGAKPDRRMV
jgi:hypothetical protein